ncbi:MAG: YbaB/EbfC family nucleoid-associated protein [Gaiellales bacterium]
MDPEDFDPGSVTAKAKDLIERGRRLEEEINSIDIDVSSLNKSIMVTMSMTGKIDGLRLDHKAVEGKEPDEIARQILETLQTAQSAVAQARQDLVKRYLPDMPDLGRVFGAPE